MRSGAHGYSNELSPSVYSKEDMPYALHYKTPTITVTLLLQSKFIAYGKNGYNQVRRRKKDKRINKHDICSVMMHHIGNLYPLCVFTL